MHYIDFQRVPDADFDVGGRRYGGFRRRYERLRRFPQDCWSVVTLCARLTRPMGSG